MRDARGLPRADRVALVAVAAAGGHVPMGARRARPAASADRRRAEGVGQHVGRASPGHRLRRADAAAAARLHRGRACFALALGIGANTAIFSIVDAVLWRPLPYPRADRVMSLAEQRPRESRWFGPVAPADYFDWRRDSRSFSAMAAYTADVAVQRVQPDRHGEPERVRPLEVTPAFLGVLGVTPALGRDFRRRGRNRRPPSRRAAQRRAVAAALRRRPVGGRPHDRVRRPSLRDRRRAAGAFWWPTHPDVVVPLALDDHDRALRAAHFLDVIGRLRDGVSPAQAREDLRIIGARLSQALPGRERQSLRRTCGRCATRSSATCRPALLVLLGAVGVRAADRVRERRDAAAGARGRRGRKNCRSGPRSARRAAGWCSRC